MFLFFMNFFLYIFDLNRGSVQEEKSNRTEPLELFKNPKNHPNQIFGPFKKSIPLIERI